MTVDEVIRTLLANADKARSLVGGVAPLLSGRREPCGKGCHHALDHAVITHPDARDPALAAKLDALAGRILGA